MHVAGLTRPITGETVCGDAYALRVTDATVSMLLCHGLGHGELAARASAEAVRLFRSGPVDPTDPVGALRRIHDGISHIQGAAAAVAVLDREAGVLRFRRQGNISGAVFGRSRRASLLSRPGIVGHQADHERFRSGVAHWAGEQPREHPRVGRRHRCGQGHWCRDRPSAGHNRIPGVRRVRREVDAKTLTDAYGDRVVPVLFDVTDDDAVTAAGATVAAAVVETGLAGLVNNAGIAIAAPIEFLPPAELRRQLDVNLVGQLAVTQALLPSLRAARGRIVNVSSISDRLCAPMVGAYSASKFALAAVNTSMRTELSPWGIQVTLVEYPAPSHSVTRRVPHTVDRIKPDGLGRMGSAAWSHLLPGWPRRCRHPTSPANNAPPCRA